MYGTKCRIILCACYTVCVLYMLLVGCKIVLRRQGRKIGMFSNELHNGKKGWSRSETSQIFETRWVRDRDQDRDLRVPRPETGDRSRDLQHCQILVLEYYLASQILVLENYSAS